MRRARVALPLLLAACGGPSIEPPAGRWPAGDVALRVTSPARAVEFGVAFPLVVERVWRDGLTPEAWDDRLLAPLVLRPLARASDTNGGRTREVRTFAAYAFERDTAALPPCRFAARAPGGDERVARSEPLEWTVGAALGEDDAAAPELPPVPLGGRSGVPGFAWALAVVVALLGGSVLLRRRRRAGIVDVAPPPPAVPERPEVPAADTARAALAELRAREPGTDAEREALLADVVEVVRAYLAAGPRLGAPEWTSEELLAAAATNKAVVERPLRALLGRVDGVKFAARAPRPADCVAALDDGLACVDAAEGAR